MELFHYNAKNLIVICKFTTSKLEVIQCQFWSCFYKNLPLEPLESLGFRLNVISVYPRFRLLTRSYYSIEESWIIVDFIQQFLSNIYCLWTECLNHGNYEERSNSIPRCNLTIVCKWTDSRNGSKARLFAKSLIKLGLP